MDLWEIALIGVGLSMDAFAVSITNGLCCTNLKKSRMLLIALCFGAFQGIMPTLGYLLGTAFRMYIEAFDHWIALGLLGYIGGKMIWDAVRGEDTSGQYALTAKLLLLQGVATSIDALAVGVSFGALPDVQIAPAACLIAGITFVLSLIGVCTGKKVGQKLGSRAQLVGGIILVCIGIKIFVEHMFLGG